MDPDNPYRVTEESFGLDGARSTIPARDWYQVDGQALICGPTVSLPRVCVRTGCSGDSELIPFTLNVMFQSFRLVRRQRTVTVHCYLAASVYRRRWWCRVFGAMLFVLSPGLALAVNSSFGQVMMIASYVALSAGVVLWLQYGISLHVDRYQDPGLHWIRGFPASVLQECQRSLLIRELSESGPPGNDSGVAPHGSPLP